MDHLSLRERCASSGPKRLLSIDGGGIRCLVSLGYLQRIQDLLRRRHGRDDLVLADYFDLIGGTSSGSIIAGALALGWTVEDIREMYLEVGRACFRPKRSWLGPIARLLGSKFDEAPLAEILRKNLGTVSLGSPAWRTGLVITAKRVDTASTWVMVNLPDHRFHDENEGIEAWKVIRASTAAPTYFNPQRIEVAEGERGVFVDGAVSMYKNPALQLLMVANLEGFGLQWPLGEDRILLCSVGSGYSVPRVRGRAVERFTAVHWLGLLVTQLMHDASELGETILQWLGASPTARSIDLQIRDLGNDLPGPAPLLTYLRYDIELERDTLAEIGFPVTEDEVEKLHEMSDVDNMEQLDRLGPTAADAQVREGHFPRPFDLASYGHRRSTGIEAPGAGDEVVVGVTGHRPAELAGAEPRRLRRRVGRAMEALADAAEASGSGPGPRIRLVSPLAEGADRLVAEEALRRGWDLWALLPFRRADYEKDFRSGDSRQEFRDLLARAGRVVELDTAAGTEKERKRGYAAVGRRLLEESDVLLALWDGRRARGEGGTGEVVTAAAAAGVPVVWIASSPPHPLRLLPDPPPVGSRPGEGGNDARRQRRAALARALERHLG